MQPITHELALKDLRHMLWMIQKARSTVAENGWSGDTERQVLADIQPWVWGDRCLLHPLNDLIARCDANGGKVPAISYYNMLIIAHTLAPAIAAWTDMGEIYAGSGRRLPEPDLKAIIEGLGLDL